LPGVCFPGSDETKIVIDLTGASKRRYVGEMAKGNGKGDPGGFVKSLALETSRVSKRGAIVVPEKFRHKFGLEEGSVVVAEEREDGILLRPAGAYPVEIYTPERKAEFLLSSAIDDEDYQAARASVQEMGLDPDQIEHHLPAAG
jgi:AbrB family looped-hinge helix DNA binding protein